MKYTRLYLKGFKPLLYGGTKKIELTDISQIVILSGENGKGKSSILRELTPYPATRTDYEKNGIKIIEMEHEGQLYTLTSDFSKTGAHSFTIDNGANLNISGTTEVQNDLVHQYFNGFTSLIEKLTAGQCKFSQISRPERCKIIMATYPSSMLFILDKYKKLMTKIRACNSQLKLMYERKLKLKESFIEDSTLKLHTKRRTLMVDAINKLDQDIFMLTQQIKPYKDKLDPSISYDKDTIQQSCNEFYADFNELILEYRDIQIQSNYQVRLSLLESWITDIEKQLTTLSANGIDILEEIEKYHKYLSTDRDQSIKDLSLMIETQEDIIKQFTFNADIPVVDKDELDKLKENASDIQEQLFALKPLQGELWSEEQYVDAEYQLHILEADIRTKSIQQQALSSDIHKLSVRLKRYTDNPYSPVCKAACKLKESIQEVMNSIVIEQSKLQEDLVVITRELEVLKLREKQLKTALQARCTARPIIQRFERLTTNKHWGNFVCSNLTFINAANINLMEIWNLYLKIIKKSEAYLKVKEAQTMLVSLNLKLDALKSDNQPAKQVITEALIKRENELKNITHTKALLSANLDKYKVEHEVHVRYQCLVDNVEDTVTAWSKLKEQIIIRSTIEFVETIINEMVSTKNDISSHLRELDTVIREQENLRTILVDEVEPVIQELSTKLNKWNLIEKQLSPKSGIPHKHSINYVNTIFVKANLIIKQVWSYDMELMYLDLDTEFDGTFKVLIGGDGIVKDISICSKGQQEIINLAIILAICLYRKYASMYPIKLDEMSSGLSPEHSTKLFDYLGEFFNMSHILQGFIVNHDPVITSSYASAGYVVLSEDYPLPVDCSVISKIN